MNWRERLHFRIVAMGLTIASAERKYGYSRRILKGVIDGANPHHVTRNKIIRDFGITPDVDPDYVKLANNGMPVGWPTEKDIGWDGFLKEYAKLMQVHTDPNEDFPGHEQRISAHRQRIQQGE